MARASDKGPAAACVQFVVHCWLGCPQIFISGWDWTEHTFGFLGEPELLIGVVPRAFVSQPGTCVFQQPPHQHAPGVSHLIL